MLISFFVRIVRIYFTSMLSRPWDYAHLYDGWTVFHHKIFIGYIFKYLNILYIRTSRIVCIKLMFFFRQGMFLKGIMNCPWPLIIFLLTRGNVSPSSVIFWDMLLILVNFRVTPPDYFAHFSLYVIVWIGFHWRVNCLPIGSSSLSPTVYLE